MNWPSRPLEECASFLSGGTPNKQRSEFWDGDIPWVSSAELTCRFINDTKLHISTDGLESGSRLVPPGTIFAVVRGMSLATEFRISLSRRPMAFNQDVKAIIPKVGIDGTFLFYALSGRADEIRDLATEAAHGTKKLEMSRLSSFRISVPDFETQRKIALIGFAYDDLISANYRRIQLLEESARLLYREWFMKLRFPGHETVPVSEGVPKGWSYEKLEAAFVLQRGFDLPAADRLDGNIPVYASTGVTGFHNQAKVTGPGVVTGRSGTLGEVHFVHEDFWPLNTTLWVKKFKKVTPVFAYFMLSALDLAVYNSGASVPTLDRKTVHAIDVLIPESRVQTQFEQAVMPMFDQIRAITKHNEKLRQARDLLLPKLMSGTWDVSRIAVPKEAAA